MLLKTQLNSLMQDGAQGAERHDVRNFQRSWRQFAAFAYVVEQYGYRYAGLSSVSPKGSPNPYFAFERTADAPERAALTSARHPHALHGGPLPGMKPVRGRLKPLPEAQRDVDLLHARIQIDYNRSHSRRAVVALVVLPLALLIPLSQTGFSLVSLLVYAAVWAFFGLLWALGLQLARRRQQRYRRLLLAAGVEWP